MSKLKCVFNCEESSNVKLNPLTEHQLGTLREKLEIRKKLKIKYHDVVFPDELLDIHGYHRKCLSNFTNIKTTYVEKYKKILLQEQQPPASSNAEGSANINLPERANHNASMHIVEEGYDRKHNF